MLHHTKVNDCVTEAGCNKQSGMTHFPEGWTRLGRRRRWLASPSGLARERAREKKEKKKGRHGPSSHQLRTAAVAAVEGGIHRREKEKKFLAGHGRLGLVGAGRVPVHVRLGHPHFWCAYDAPSLHRPKAWAGEATNSETSC